MWVYLKRIVFLHGYDTAIFTHLQKKKITRIKAFIRGGLDS